MILQNLNDFIFKYYYKLSKRHAEEDFAKNKLRKDFKRNL